MKGHRGHCHGLGRSFRKHTGRACLLAGVASLVLGASSLDVAHAETPNSGLEAFGAPVADEDLGEMRGKFVSPAGIAYFGVEMRSSWTNADGITIAGVLAFSLDLRNASGGSQGAVPLLLVGWNRDCAGCTEGPLTPSTPGGGAPTITIGGLNTVHGAVQSQEIRGSDNVVQNNLRIDVLPAGEVHAAQHSGLTPTTSSTTQQLPDGAAVHFIVTGNQLGLALENGPGAGLVGQTVDSGLNQISQNVMLTSNLNTVHNSVGLTVGVDQMRQAEQFNIQNSISAMKGLGY